MEETEKYCVDCFESKFCNACQTCGKTIGTESRVSKGFNYFIEGQGSKHSSLLVNGYGKGSPESGVFE